LSSYTPLFLCSSFTSAVSRMAVLVLAVASASAASAAIYYVDVETGRDTNTGLAASTIAGAPAPTPGPWQTLARVTAAALQPGDQVLLRCGQTWRETLVLNKGGAPGLPVLVGTYPFACSNQPVIGGVLTPQADDWDLVQGNIYKVKLPLSSLANGRMKTNLAGWRYHSGTPGASFAYRASCSDGLPCGEFLSGAGGGLIISPPMTLQQGQRYTVRFKAMVPAGAVYGVSVRRFQSPYNMQSGYFQTVGTGSWQDQSFSFVAPASLADARVDMDTGAQRVTQVRDVRVEADVPVDDVFHVVSAQGVVNIASHPNRGYSAASPESPYLPTGTSPVARGADGRLGSAYLVPAVDHQLPPGATLAAGIDVWVRSQAWSVRKLKVTSVVGKQVFFDGLSTYPLNYPGWGYFFTGARWMLDAPGEWFYDRSTRELSIWMPDGAAPGQRVGLGTVARAATIGNPNNGTFPQHITLDNLAFKGTGEGLAISRMKNITLRKLTVEETASWGVFGDGSDGLVVENSVFKRTRADALLVNGSNDSRIVNNTISESGVLVDANGKVKSLPRENYAAILTGGRSLVADNVLTNVGYNGILAMTDSTIRDNVLQNFALVLNDSGGIYGAGAARVTITGNLIKNGVGDRNGIPNVIQSVAAGMYLDGNADGFVVRDNVISGSDYCVQMHDSYNSTLENNTCYGARRSTIWLQESSTSKRAAGDNFNNVVRGNALFQTSSGPTILLASSRTTVDDFALFDANVYSSFASPIAAQEASPGYQKAFTLAEWKMASTTNGPRNLEVTGRVAAPLRSFAVGLQGPNLVAGLLTSAWSLSGGGTGSISPSCGPSSTPCMTYASAANQNGFISSPRFPLTKGKWYRASFDAMVNVPTQSVTVMAMRSGPSYENLMGLNPFEFSGSTSWKRYSFSFQATADALPSSAGPGARVDLMNVAPGNWLRLANFELTEIQPSVGSSAFNTLLSNSERAPALAACPVAGVQCSKFFEFPSGQRVTWPIQLAPRAAKVVFVQDDSLPDSDGDGIADAQDQCPNTPPDTVVNAIGCSLAQR
jgi:parallel beta-helix repeat protein